MYKWLLKIWKKKRNDKIFARGRWLIFEEIGIKMAKLFVKVEDFLKNARSILALLKKIFLRKKMLC